MRNIPIYLILAFVIIGCIHKRNAPNEDKTICLDSAVDKSIVKRNVVLKNIDYSKLEINGFSISKKGSTFFKDSKLIDSILDINIDGMEQLEKVYYLGINKIYYSEKLDQIVGFDLFDNTLSLNIKNIKIGYKCDSLLEYVESPCVDKMKIETKKSKYLFIPVWSDDIQWDEGLDIELFNNTIIRISYSWKI